MRPFARIVAAALIAALLATPSVADAAPSDASVSALLGLINRFRAAHDLAPLADDPTLDAVARRHGEDMTARGYFDHVTPEGGDLAGRLWNAGYHFAVAAENLARGYRNAAAVLAGWQGSPGHRANLLRDDVDRAGIGIVSAPIGADPGPVWVLVLARPRGN